MNSDLPMQRKMPCGWKKWRCHKIAAHKIRLFNRVNIASDGKFIRMVIFCASNFRHKSFSFHHHHFMLQSSNSEYFPDEVHFSFLSFTRLVTVLALSSPSMLNSLQNYLASPIPEMGFGTDLHRNWSGIPSPSDSLAPSRGKGWGKGSFHFSWCKVTTISYENHKVTYFFYVTFQEIAFCTRNLLIHSEKFSEGICKQTKLS